MVNQPHHVHQSLGGLLVPPQSRAAHPRRRRWTSGFIILIALCDKNLCLGYPLIIRLQHLRRRVAVSGRRSGSRTLLVVRHQHLIILDRLRHR